ncbi:hypothetical protein GYB22_02950 [bacterium]|nr:hypothetical protein [bacterium]
MRKQVSLIAFNNIGILFFCIGLAVLMRAYSFSLSVIDWDESTYILGAQALLEGYTPYSEFIDTKPIGIFYAFAPFVSVASPWIIIRIMGALIIGLTAFILSRLCKEFWNMSIMSSYLVAIFYLIAVSFYSFSFATGSGQGMAINTEHITNLFIVLWIWFAHKKKWFLAGACVGLAFSINFLIGFSALFLLFLFNRRSISAYIQDGANTALGFFSGLAIPLLYLHSQGGFFAYLEIFDLTLNGYSEEFNAIENLKFIGSSLYTASSLLLVILISLIFALKDKIKIAGAFWPILVWLVLAFIGAGFTGKYFFHYAIPAFIPLAIIASGGFWPIAESKLKVILIVVLISIPFIGVYKYLEFPKKDISYQIGLELQQHIKEGEKVFIFSRDHIAYTMVDQLPPTPYFHPGLLQDPKHRRALQINLSSELTRVFKKDPKYVLTGEGFDELVKPYLQKQYVPLTDWEGGRTLYIRKSVD